jgi:hypothetical protein
VTILTAVALLLLALLAAPTSGLLRVGVAVVMAILILGTGLRRMRRFTAIPPDPEEITGTGELRYVCTMCGLELAVTEGTRGKAPTHCREPMVLIGDRGAPPLKTVD